MITKHGKPVAKILPNRATSADLIGTLQGNLTIKGDVMTTRSRRVPLA